MNKIRIIYAIFLIAIVISLASVMMIGLPLEAKEISQSEARKLRGAGQILPLEKILAAAKKIKPGDVLESELEHERGKYIYELELLDSTGQVWELKLDAKTGQLIKLEVED